MKRLVFLLLLIACGEPPTAIEPPVVDRFDVEVSFTATFNSNCDYEITAVASDSTRAVIYELTVSERFRYSGHFFGTYESFWQQGYPSSAGLRGIFSSGTWSKVIGLSASCG